MQVLRGVSVATLYSRMQVTDRWCTTGKQTSRKNLKPTNGGVKTRSTSENIPSIVDHSRNAVQDDVLHARGSPPLEDVRELLSSGDDPADTREIVVTSPPPKLDETPDDDTATENQDGGPSETLTITNQATSTNEGSPDAEALTFSDVGPSADEASKVNHDVAVTQGRTGNSDSVLMGSFAKSAVDVNVPSSFCHEDIVNAQAAMTAQNACTSSSDEIHSRSAPEASPIDGADAQLSVLKSTPKTLARAKLVSEQSSLDLSLMPSANVNTPKRASPRKKSAVTTPGAISTPKLLLSAELVRPDFLIETPQIGTSLLRRESLRRKESSNKKRDARMNKTPKKRDTLQRRDTLQEREILQRIIAETTSDHSDENSNAPPSEPNTLPSSSSAPSEDNIRNNALGSSAPFLLEEESDSGTIANAKAVLPAIDEINVEKDLHRAMEAIEVYENLGIADASQSPLGITPRDTEGMEAMDKANEVLAKTELDDVSQATESMREQTPNQKTRSGARFSDDTSMLKDFLNRAQARKAAQKPVFPAPEAAVPQHSPRRSPRKMHGSHNGQSSSPQKPRNVATRPNTPPSKPKPEVFDSDDGEEQTAEPASCRRSTRTRPPAPSKTVPGAPSFIPVRRADGTDPVVLQKSQAQELAVTTRANTRRNKGQSKPPLLALQDLPTETTDLASSGRQRVERAKSVAWAERLASYRDANGESDEIEERRPKVRRLRGLGAVNGTPAAKRTTAVVSNSNGTPAPKRRGKV